MWIYLGAEHLEFGIFFGSQSDSQRTLPIQPFHEEFDTEIKETPSQAQPGAKIEDPKNNRRRERLLGVKIQKFVKRQTEKSQNQAAHQRNAAHDSEQGRLGHLFAVAPPVDFPHADCDQESQAVAIE